MSQINIDDLALLVKDLHLTVQRLSGKIDGSVSSFGNSLLANGKYNRDDAGGTAEQKPFQRGDVEVAEVVSDLIPGSDGLGDKDIVKENVVEQAEIEVGRAEVPIDFGAFSGRVPVGVDRLGQIMNICASSESVASSLVERESESWSDMVEEELNNDGKNDKLNRVKVDADNFFRDFVRTSAVKEFKNFLASRGVVVKKRDIEELSLSRYATGSVPSAYLNGRVRIKGLALVGDKVMALVVTQEMYSMGKSSSDIQDYLSRVLTRTALSPVCVGSGLSRFVVAPSGVDIGKTSVGGEVLEAIAGVVFHSCGFEGVRKFMLSMQLL